MPRILAVDFGERRIGLATSDASGSLATPRQTLNRRDDEGVARAILEFCRQEEVEVIVFGIPRSPEGKESPFASRIRSFARKLAASTPIPIHFHEETLTSDEAARRLPRKSPRESFDRMAAAVLLEDFLDHSGGKRR